MAHSSSSAFWVRIFVVSLLLASTYAFGWYKSSQNQRDRQTLAAWRQHLEDLTPEAESERSRLVSWLRSLHSHDDAKREIEEELNSSKPLDVADGEVFRWSHPEYGIPVMLEFHGSKLGSTAVFGPQLTSVSPEPKTTYRSGRAEAIRAAVVEILPWIWGVALLVALVPSQHSSTAVAAMLGLSFAYGGALAVSPYYDLSIHGIFSNDSLFFALLMYSCSVIIIAFRMRQDRLKNKVRFELRTLVIAITITVISLITGPFGYVAFVILLLGWLACFVLVHRFKELKHVTPARSQTSVA